MNIEVFEIALCVLIGIVAGCGLCALYYGERKRKL